MTRFRLQPDTYMSTTPAGAYYAVSADDRGPARSFLLHLLARDKSPRSSLELLSRSIVEHTDEQRLALLHRIQSMGWIQSEQESRSAPSGTLETVLPDKLSHLSSVNKALLADSDGFYVATWGYPHETAEELSALSADFYSLYERHKGLLRHNLGLGSSAWAIVNAAGDSQIGCWPIYVGTERFVLVISGLPQLNQPAFTDLVWALAMRYGSVEQTAAQGAVGTG